MKILKCEDFGQDCPAEFRGATVEAVLDHAKRHGMAVHGQSREQVDSEETRRIAEANARDVEE